MQNRSDRIHFPEVNSDILWRCADPEIGLHTPERVKSKFLSVSSNKENFMEATASPISGSVDFMHLSAEKYFEWRERAGILTPAKTPSDILRRCPVYLSSSDSDSEELSHIVNSDSASPRREYVKGQIRFHRERQLAIERSMVEFDSKMRKMLEWHKDQELLNRNLLK